MSKTRLGTGGSPDLPPSKDISSFEYLYGFEDQLRAVSKKAGSSISSTIELAFAATLETFVKTESLRFAIRSSSGKWHKKLSELEGQRRLLYLLENDGNHWLRPDSGENDTQFGLSSTTLDEYPEAEGEDISLEDCTAIPELELLLVVQLDSFTGSILLRCEYNSSKFREWKARSIVATFRHILKEIAHRPETQLNQIDLLNPRDLQSLMDWNPTPKGTVNKCVHEMIKEQVLAAPNSPAVDAWDGQLSYAELDDSSSKVAHFLFEQGLGPESVVALCFEKSVWNIVATLGVLKAGAAFCPLDHEQPIERLQQLIEQINPKVILTSKQFFSKATILSQSALGLDSEWIKTASDPTSKTRWNVNPWNLAYIMFTSGSTGNPKGVMIEHSACSSSILAHGRATGFNVQTRALQYSRHTFDASISEILTTLGHGGVIVIPSEEQRMNNIAAVIRDKKVNWALITPSMLRLLDPASIPELKTLIAGGEAVPQDVIEKWAPNRKLINGYGPTENTILSTLMLLKPSTKAGKIGRGVGSSCWIADPENPNRLVPHGATGELLLESPQLSRGYLNYGPDEGPNRAFVRDPTWLVKQGRRAILYRTGDLCSFNENGEIVFEGRKDTQIKISGQRLEASEVEIAIKKTGILGDHDVIVDVLERPGQNGTKLSKALVAFINLKLPLLGSKLQTTYKSERNGKLESSVDSSCILPEQDPKLANLIPQVDVQISRLLPSWMIPSVYIPLTSMPLSANGKIDLKTLRQDASRLTSKQFSSFMLLDSSDDENESEYEQTIRSLWAHALGVESDFINRKSNFFRLGGDSLAAMQIVNNAREQGLRMTVAGIFKNPTLKSLALSVTPIKGSETFQDVAPFEMIDTSGDILKELARECSIEVDSIEDAFPCTALQEGFMALTASRTASTSSRRYTAQHIMELPDDIDIERLKRAWQSVAMHRGILRTRIVQTLQAGMLQVIVKEPLSWQESSDMDSYVEADINQPIGFGTPLNRYGIVCQNDTVKMVWSAHHAVVDGYSINLTLQAVYESFMGIYRPVKGSFPAFIRQIRRVDKNDEKAFWESKLNSNNYSIYPKLPSNSYKCLPRHYVRRTLPKPTKTNVTVSTVFRAAWALALSQFSDSKEVVFGITSSGRHGLIKYQDSIVGPTFASFPLLVDCDGNTTAHEFLENIQARGIDSAPFEQAGLLNIARINDICKAVCNFHSIVVVQPDLDMGIDGEVFLGYDWPQNLHDFNNFAIMVECNLRKTQVDLNINYDNAVLDEDIMTRLVDYFEAAVDFLNSENSEKTVGEFLEEPTVQDIQKIQSWNDIYPVTVEACIHHLFEEQVKAQRDAEAVFAWDGCLTFSELDDRASKLARHLVDLGVGPKVTVPYCFEKSVYTVVSMLAILKAGGTMIPLDPTHPLERIKSIINSSEVKVVTTSPSNKYIFDGLDLQTVIVGVHLFQDLDKAGTVPFSSKAVEPNSAATILFTSGSTGKPKGVVQEHKTLVSAAYGHSVPLQMYKGSRILQFSAHVFDVSIIEIINAFVLGACICIPETEERLYNLADFVARSRADWAFLTPSFARTLVPQDFPLLKTLCMGGEAVPLDSVKTWEKHVELINGYGPCEGSICISANLSNGSSPPDAIGRGVNCLIWIVNQNDHNQLLPIGSVGEILLEGPNVARGYFGDHTKTGESFIYDPKWIKQFDFENRKRKLYKTGDLGRLDSKGFVTYLGRKDTQVKIRGQRIELDEVEYHLKANLPDDAIVAADAIVLPGTVDASLVAFIQNGKKTPEQNNPCHEPFGKVFERLRSQLSIQLPKYMVPAAFIPIKSMPFTSTQKLDRRELRLHVNNLSIAEIFMSSETTIDIELLDQSEDVAMAINNHLVDLLGAKDMLGSNFIPFQAGMDSIQVISLANFVRKTFDGVSLPVQRYMDSSATLRDIARWITEARQDSNQLRSVHSSGFLLQEIEKYDKRLAGIEFPKVPKIRKAVPEIVFLTGATGFLGNRILLQLLKRRETRKVITLVRGRDQHHADERLISLARTGGWWKEEYASRIEVWHGHLSKPKLGLSEKNWSRLCGEGDNEEIDAIIHNGASVNWLADYEALTAANILSTVVLLEALTLNASRGLPHFVYVSGGHLSTAPDNYEAIARELMDADYPAYSKTKFVSEVLVARYTERLAKLQKDPSRISIIKPGLIAGNTTDGICNTDDFVWRVAASVLDTGCFNNDERSSWLAIAGVDFVSRIIIDSMQRPESIDPSEPVKILNGLSMSKFWDVVIEETDRDVIPTDGSTWMRTMKAAVEAKGPTHRLWPVMHVLEDSHMLGQPLNGLTEEKQKKDQDEVIMAVRKSLRYLIAIGYIESSRGSSDASSEEGEHRVDKGLLSPVDSVFVRTPTTPSWEKEKVIGPRKASGKEGIDVYF